MEPVSQESLLSGEFSAILTAIIAGIMGFSLHYWLAHHKRRSDEKKEKASVRLKYFIPLLRNLYELDDRISRILTNLDKDWLDANYLVEIKNKEGFASDPNKTGYFIISSIYLVACFFGLTEAIIKDIDTTKTTILSSSNKGLLRGIQSKFRRKIFSKLKDSIFQFDPEISAVRRLFQYEELFDEYIRDKNYSHPRDSCKLHRHIQHSVGEMMFKSTELKGFRIKSFREFYEDYISKKEFQFWFVLMENIFVDLSNFTSNKSLEKSCELQNDIRPLRLIAIQYWCRILMGNLSKQFDFESHFYRTRSASDVLKGLSTELGSTIEGYKLENRASHNYRRRL